MVVAVTPSAISTILSSPTPDSPSSIPELVIQIVDLKPVGTSNTRFKFMANDGSMKLKAMLPTSISSEVQSGKLPNFGLIRILDYTCNAVPNQPQKVLIVTKCEVASPALEEEVKVKGTQIRATMFNEAAKKFYPKFELGKVYYISRGTLKLANRQFKTVSNDYEMTLNENSEVEEATDVIVVVQHVSSTLSIRRKSDNEDIPKRDITIPDESKHTVVVSLWNELATKVGQELLDMVDTFPVVAIKSLKVGDFQVSRSSVVINPDTSEAKKLRSWYDSEGKESSMASIGSGMISSKSGSRSMYSDRVFLSHIVGDTSLGQDKPAWFSIKAYISFIKPDQTMWYRACKACNKKVTEAIGSGYWCEGCQKNDADSSLRYIMVVRVTDSSGEAYVSTFNEQAEKIIGCSADELETIKSEDEKAYEGKLKEATWMPHLFRVSVVQSEYMNEKRRRITVRSEAPVDFAAETKHLLEELPKSN